MRNPWFKSAAWIGSLVSVLLVIGCAGVGSPDPSASSNQDVSGLVEALMPDVEALYLAWHRLDAVYKDIKALEKGLLFDPDDRRLGYVQKASLYVQDAALRIHHQWQRLSVIGYIRHDSTRDYLTLCVKGLTSDLDEIAYDRMFLRIYAPAIGHPAVAADVDRAMAAIDANVAVLERILKALEPVAARPPFLT